MIRTNRIKGLGVEESDLADAEKALKNYGIEIRKADGSIQPFMTTLEQLSGTWDSLNEQEQFNLGEAMGKIHCPLVA